jgi:hypothetical protein
VSIAAPSKVAEILPNWVNDGQAVTVVIHGLEELAGQEVWASIAVFDAVEAWWHTEAPVILDANGNGSAELAHGLSVGQHAAVYVDGVRHQGGYFRFDHVLVSIANAATPGSDLEAVMAEFAKFQAAQRELYDTALGNADAGDADRYRAIILVDGLLLTAAMRLPGAVIRPVAAQLSKREHLDLLNDRLAELGWISRIPADRWTDVVAGQSHLAEIVVPSIWAASMDEAMGIVADVEERVLTVLSRHRGSAGRVIASVIEQPRSDGGADYRVLPYVPGYRGNLAGGPLSGENQRTIAGEYLAVDRDPILRLAADLYVEALAERSPDARFFRLWSILEFLSGARVPKATPVLLTDGTAWPGSSNTTSYAAPRVYQYVAHTFQAAHLDNRSAVQPAPDLYSAVRGWYGRRNATGHYGRFVTTDPQQQAQGWYQHALTTATDESQWLRAFERVVELAITHELRAVAPPM